jgi:hypothetical protein
MERGWLRLVDGRQREPGRGACGLGGSRNYLCALAIHNNKQHEGHENRRDEDRNQEDLYVEAAIRIGWTVGMFMRDSHKHSDAGRMSAGFR